MRKYIFILLVIVIFFNGLKGVRELTDLAIVKSIGIDISEEGEIVFTAIVTDTSNKEKLNGGDVYTSKGNSVQEAARNMVDFSPKKLYIAHLETLVISEDIAKEHLENALDFFIRDNEGSNSFYLFIANGSSAEEVINVINEEEIDMVSFLNSTQKYKGDANLKTLNDILRDIIEEGTQVTVNSIAIKEDKIITSDMAYFDKWNMKGYLTDEESILYNMLINQTQYFITSIDKDDDLVVAEVTSSKAKYSIDKNDNSCVNLKLNVNANITQTGKNIKLNDEEAIKNIQNKLEEEINKKINEFYRKIKDEYKVDILSLGNLLYRKKNKLFENPDYLNSLNLNVDTKVKIVNQGGVKKVW